MVIAATSRTVSVTTQVRTGQVVSACEPTCRGVAWEGGSAAGRERSAVCVCMCVCVWLWERGVLQHQAESHWDLSSSPGSAHTVCEVGGELLAAVGWWGHCLEAIVFPYSGCGASFTLISVVWARAGHPAPTPRSLPLRVPGPKPLGKPSSRASEPRSLWGRSQSLRPPPLCRARRRGPALLD